MSTIIACQCGAKVRIADPSPGKQFRCPQCKTGLVTGQNGVALAIKVASLAVTEATCPICQTKVQADDEVIVCPSCDQAHHRECWAEIGGCSTYGCKQAPASEKPQPEATPLAAWGDTKKCPACGETIKAIALKCRYCGTEFDTVDPLTTADLRRQAQKQEGLESLQRGVIAYFVVAVVGCVAPLAAIIGLAWLLPQRRKLRQAGPFYLVLGYAGIVLSVIYSVLMLVFAIFHSAP